MKKIFVIFISLITIMSLYSLPNSYAFTRMEDLVFDGSPVEADKLNEVLKTIKKNKRKNKKPTKLSIIKAKQKNPKNIQFEIDTSGVVANTAEDIQLPISNQAFLDAVTEAITLWDDVDIADVTFAPLKFTSSQANFEDGKNVITSRAIEAPEGAPEGGTAISLITYARTNRVLFMGKEIMVKPGTILDADIVYDPSNDSCLALHTTEGDIVTGGSDSPIVEGGINLSRVESCEFISAGDITDLAVGTIANALGLEFSAIASAASSPVTKIMTRYALTNDDKLGLANIYPNKANLTNHGSISGRVLLNKKPVRGAHVVLEDTTTGEPVTSTITNIAGKFEIKIVPAGTYNVYAEPLDGPVRQNAITRNFFGFTPQLNFTTGVFPNPVTVRHKKRSKNINIKVEELSASAFNINHLTSVLTEDDVNKAGGAALLPIRIMAGKTLTDVQFWGDNISTNFGTLSISGSGITVSNVQSASVRISPFNIECESCDDTPTESDPNPTPCNRDPACPPDSELTKAANEIPGITADITCDIDVEPGPRNIIFIGNQVDPTHPSFGLRDQITGGLIVTE